MMLQYQTRKGLKALLCKKRNRPELWALHSTFYTNITITRHSLQVATAASLCWILLPSQAVLPFRVFFPPSSNEFTTGTVKHTREPARRRHRWALHDASLIATDVTSHINKNVPWRKRSKVEVAGEDWAANTFLAIWNALLWGSCQWIVVILIADRFKLIFKVIY